MTFSRLMLSQVPVQRGPSSTVGYYLRILSGVAAGEIRKIIDIPTAGSVKLDAPWTTGKIPKPNDLYEVGVGIQVNGDGVNVPPLSVELQIKTKHLTPSWSTIKVLDIPLRQRA